MHEVIKKKVKILLTNDDGIDSEGLYALYRELQDVGEVFVVAPKTERSACGHAITLSEPLRIEEVEKQGQLYGYAVSGTPVDCVKLAVSVILKSRPDLVISGINRGFNTGAHILYSGTVSAALEAVILGIPSIAASCGATAPGTMDTYLTQPAVFIKRLAHFVLQKGLPSDTLLNVNIPFQQQSGSSEVVITQQARSFLRDSFQKRIDPRNRTYYWLDAEEMPIVKGGNNGYMMDIEAVQEGKISITPIRFDLTDHQSMDWLQARLMTDLSKY